MAAGVGVAGVGVRGVGAAGGGGGGVPGQHDQRGCAQAAGVAVVLQGGAREGHAGLLMQGEGTPSRGQMWGNLTP